MTDVLLVGGWACPSAWLAPLAQAFSAAWRPQAIALHDLDADPARWGAALAGRIASCRAPPWVVGWSLGGMVALLAFSDERPPPAAGLALVASTLRFTATDGWPAAQPTSALRAFRAAVAAGPLDALAKFRAACAWPATPPAEDLARAAAEMAALGMPVLEGGLDLLADLDLRDARLPADLRAACLHGASDPIIPPEAAVATASRLGARLELLPDIGHDLPMRCPDRIVSAVASLTAACGP